MDSEVEYLGESWKESWSEFQCVSVEANQAAPVVDQIRN